MLKTTPSHHTTDSSKDVFHSGVMATLVTPDCSHIVRRMFAAWQLLNAFILSLSICFNIQPRVKSGNVKAELGRRSKRNCYSGASILLKSDLVKDVTAVLEIITLQCFQQV